MLVAGCSMLDKEKNIPESIQYPETSIQQPVTNFIL
jgi:hypothetical protein